ncbi:hypothetical protein JST97_37310 [bacterium]|nr:hypothetical protein [bacterium]
MNISSLSNAQPALRSGSARPAAGSEKPAAAPSDSVILGQGQQTPPQQPAPPTQPAPPAQPAPPQQIEPKEWTVLVYSVSDNNLYDFMQTDLDEAERIGSTPEMNVVVETSHQPKGGNVVRMKLEADQSEGLKSPVVQDLGPSRDMANSDNLADTIAWAQKNYPAKHFMVILSDHGGGWQGANQSESQNSWMGIADIEAGLKKAVEKSGQKIDVVGFDECLMASAEVAHQLVGTADYMVGSEEVEGGAGWQYDEALGGKTSSKSSRVFTGDVLNYAAAALRARDPLTPADMAKGIVKMAEGHQRDLGTMSAIDLNKMPAVSKAMDKFAGAVLDSGKTKKDFALIKAKTQKFYEFGDMGHFVELAGKKFGGKIGEAADEVKAAMGEAVIAEQHGSKYPNAKGLNVELNANPGMTGGTNVQSEGGGLTDQQMQQLVQIMVMQMSPEQVQMLAQAMPQIVALNQQFHAQQGGGEEGGDASKAAAQQGPAHPIPNMTDDSAKRIQFASYESIKLSQDTRWAEMIKKVG